MTPILLDMAVSTTPVDLLQRRWCPCSCWPQLFSSVVTAPAEMDVGRGKGEGPWTLRAESSPRACVGEAAHLRRKGDTGRARFGTALSIHIIWQIREIFDPFLVIKQTCLGRWFKYFRIWLVQFATRTHVVWLQQCRRHFRVGILSPAHKFMDIPIPTVTKFIPAPNLGQAPNWSGVGLCQILCIQLKDRVTI